jgi:type IV pilus assembly protein PilV
VQKLILVISIQSISRGIVMEKRNVQDLREMKQEGFTLLEVMISICILMAGLLAVGTMQVSAIYGNSLAGKTTQATSIAQDKMEELLNQQYTLTATHPDLLAGDHVGGAVSGYSTTWAVVDNTPVPNCKTITVTVTWRDKGKINNTSLRSCLAM